MKIEQISISVFEQKTNTAYVDMVETALGASQRWQVKHQRQSEAQSQKQIHVLHVLTDSGVEGVCTVGDARYPTMQLDDLEQLRIMALGEDPLARQKLFAKLHAATRFMFTRPGWFGAFDNCLWDIAGKVAGLPVYALIGKARDRCPAYYNFGGVDKEAAVADACQAVERGFLAVKDHFSADAVTNIAWFEATRQAVGERIDILHDAAGCTYSLQDALRVGRALEAGRYGWFEEPLADRDQAGLQHLCAALDIPVVAPETLMHDLDLSAQWLISGATDYMRANARHGVTATLKLAHLAEMHRQRIELNGPGGLFGLVHVHLVCAIINTSYYEYFPGGSRDEMGRNIGLLNPPVPQDGHVMPPLGAGWGAEWDWDYFKKKRVAQL